MKYIIQILFISTIIVLGYLLLRNIGNEFQDLENKFKTEIGKEIILHKDTLIILDYSLINETFTLNNGTKMSYELLTKCKIVE